MYNQNRIYISKKEQKHMRDFKIVFGGLGLGSVIAETALRMGFETLHLVDGDIVELSNLNRQNYEVGDVGKPKALALFERLKRINPNANITYANVFLTAENLVEHLNGADVAVNAIDFTSDAPLVFDDVCFEMGIPSVHPYNLGYGGLACVVTQQSKSLRDLSSEFKGMEVHVANHVLNEIEKKDMDINTLKFKTMLTEYIAEQGTKQPPQLSIAAWLLGGLCADIFLKMLRDEFISVFPKFYCVNSERSKL